MRRWAGWLGILTLGSLALLNLGCAGLAEERQRDSIEAVLAASPDRVRVALMDVLTEGGYTVKKVDDSDSALRTGYRREIGSPWNRLLVSRFGVGRSWIECAVVPAGAGGTRLSIQVTYEAKDRQWSFWEPAQPPLAQSAANQLRLVKNALGLL